MSCEGSSAAAEAAADASASLSEVRAGKLAELRVRVALASSKLHASDAIYWASDHALLRVLSARSDDVAKAAAQYEGIVAFRVEKECWRFLDASFYQEPEAMRRYFGWGFAGVDLDGYPVLVERIGKNDVLALSEAVGTEEFLRWVIFYHESQERMMREASAATGRDRHKMSVLVDLAGYKLAGPATLAVIFARTRMEEDNYPEIVRRVFLLNCPSLFATLWTVVSAFMDRGTRSKVQLLGANFLPTVLKYIHVGQVPAFLGGKMADQRDDPQCRSMVAAGGILPLAFLTGVAADGNGVGEQVALVAGATSQVVILLPAGAKLAWTWGVGEKDINFQIDARIEDMTSSSSSTIIDARGLTNTIYGMHRINKTVAPINAAHDSNANANAPAAAAAPASSPATAASTDTAAWPTLAPASTPDLAISLSERSKKGKGSWTAPGSEAAVVYRVRLAWYNESKWMTCKHLARRVDVIIDGAGGGAAAASRADDVDGQLALEREEHRAKIAEWIMAVAAASASAAPDAEAVPNITPKSKSADNAEADANANANANALSPPKPGLPSPPVPLPPPQVLKDILALAARVLTGGDNALSTALSAEAATPDVRLAFLRPWSPWHGEWVQRRDRALGAYALKVARELRADAAARPAPTLEKRPSPPPPPPPPQHSEGSNYSEADASGDCVGDNDDDYNEEGEDGELDTDGELEEEV